MQQHAKPMQLRADSYLSAFSFLSTYVEYEIWRCTAISELMINEQIRDKEVRLSPNIDTNDLNTKIGSARKFIEKGNKVKVTLRFRGREMAHQQIGMEVLNRVKDDLQELAVVESFPTMIEGRQMIMVLAPKKKR